MVGVRRQADPLWFVIVTVAAASSVSLLGGVGLEAVANRLLPLIPLLIALPALNTMVGDYASIIAAHAGDPYERARSRHKLAVALGWSVILNAAGTIVLSLLLAKQRGYDAELGFSLLFGAFVAMAIIVSVAFMFAITFFLDKVLKKHRLNPDDVLIPVVTSVSDVLMLGMIASAAYFLF